MAKNNDYLTVARDFLIVGEKEKAYVHYGKVSQDNPENAEAEFFAAYLGYLTLLDEKNYPSAVNAFKAMAACIKNAIKCVKESDLSDSGKKLILAEMVNCYVPITRYFYTRKISNSSNTIETGVIGIYALGDAIKKDFGTNEEIMALAAEAWKEAIAIQRQFYAYKYNGINPEDYAKEIQKLEPTYIMPKKSGCISLA